jgi:hypothetical protein
MIALVLLLILVAGPAFAEEPQTIDVVYLKDGTTLRGLIIEQEAGVSVKLASADGIVWTLEDGEIDLIEKEPAPEPLAVQYSDVLLLKDGVLFRGSVEEQRPGDSVDLRTSTGALLRIPVEDVWAFVKRKQVVGVASAPAPAVDTETEPLRIRLQIEIASRPLAQVAGAGALEAGESGETGESESTLEEEIDTLERERDNADHQALDEERDSERRDLQTLDEDISDLLDQLLADLQECGQQGGVGQADSAPRLVAYKPSAVAEASTAAGFASQYTDLLGGMVDKTLEKIPTDAVITTLARQAEDSRALQNLLFVPSRLARRLELDRIRVLASRLPIEERQRLYEMNQRRDALKGALLNAIPFTFAGSWSQGDSLSGGLGIAVFVASVAVDITMAVQFANPTAIQTPWGWATLQHDPATWNFWVAPACYLATYAVGIIMPPLRANEWNEALAKALDVDKSPPTKAPQPRAGTPPVALVPGPRGEPRLEVQLLSLRY